MGAVPVPKGEAPSPRSVNSTVPVNTPLQVLAPADGQSFAIGDDIDVEYRVDGDLANSSEGNLSYELYLVSAQGTVMGMVGRVDPTRQTYVWKSSTLVHWAGTDTTNVHPAPGIVRVLLVAQTLSSEPSNTPNILIDHFTWFDGHHVYTNNSGLHENVRGVISTSASGAFELRDH